VGAVEQGSVVGLGEAAAFTFASAVNLDPVQQAWAFPGANAVQFRDRDPAGSLI